MLLLVAYAASQPQGTVCGATFIGPVVRAVLLGHDCRCFAGQIPVSFLGLGSEPASHLQSGTLNGEKDPTRLASGQGCRLMWEGPILCGRCYPEQAVLGGRIQEAW